MANTRCSLSTINDWMNDKVANYLLNTTNTWMNDKLITHLVQLVYNFFVLVSGCDRVANTSNNHIKIDQNLFSKPRGIMEVFLLCSFRLLSRNIYRKVIPLITYAYVLVVKSGCISRMFFIWWVSFIIFFNVRICWCHFLWSERKTPCHLIILY